MTVARTDVDRTIPVNLAIKLERERERGGGEGKHIKPDYCLKQSIHLFQAVIKYSHRPVGCVI